MNRPVALFLLLLALLVRMAVPDGWMVSAAPGGAVLALCSGKMPSPGTTHAQMQHAPADHHQSEEDEEAGVDQPCAFAALGLADRPGDVSAPPPVRPRVSSPAPAAAVAIGRGLAAPPPPARGPPAFA